MRRIALLIVMAVLLLGLPQQAWAQSGIVVSDVGVFDTFGEHVTFEARIQSPVPIANIDLVFSDMVLPDRSGVQLYQEILAACPDLKVLFSSGYSDERSEWELIKEKGLPFLAKPYSVEQLLQAVRLAVL